jgi:hypothetical protein
MYTVFKNFWICWTGLGGNLGYALIIFISSYRIVCLFWCFLAWFNSFAFFFPRRRLIEYFFLSTQVWKTSWLAGIPYLADSASETVWPTQVLIYYETILGMLDPLVAEVKFLVNLTRESYFHWFTFNRDRELKIDNSYGRAHKARWTDQGMSHSHRAILTTYQEHVS